MATTYLTPGAARAGIIDFSTNEGMKFYNNAIKGLEPKYDLKPEDLKSFLEYIKQRANSYGFRDILEVPTEESTRAAAPAVAAAATVTTTTTTAPPSPGGTVPAPTVTTTAPITVDVDAILVKRTCWYNSVW
jgi:hypothetical protein